MKSFLTRLGALAACGVASVLLVGSANAAPPPPISTPLECINSFSNNPDYVSEGWVAAEVASWNGVFLGCGDERSGIIHIAHPESTGSIHPVFEDTQSAFLACFRNIANSGAQRPDDEFPQTRTRYERSYVKESILGPVRLKATLIRLH